jgi:hypothetical protein
MTKPLHVGVVVVVSAGAKNEKVAAPGALAHPLKGSIEVFPSAH